MKKLYWGIATLIIILIISFSVVMLTRNTNTDPTIITHKFSDDEWDDIRKEIKNRVKTAEKPTIKIGEDTTDTNTEANTERDNIETEKVSVSPHGFGPYPEIPEDYRYPQVDWSKYHDNPMHELMIRVRIRLWKQGHQTQGILEESNGLLYPISRGTVYVQRSDNGVFSSGSIIGHPRDLSDDVKQQLRAGEIPAGLTVLDYDKGIDPYKFLNIRRMPE